MAASFTSAKSVKQLQKLALNPIDLSAEGVFTPSRIAEFVSEAAGFRLLYATERVTPDVMQQLISLGTDREIVTKMRRMQSGEIMNKIEGVASENRPALHTATRDFFSNPQTAPAAKEAAALAKHEVDKLARFIKKIDADHQFTDVVCIGIGGSDLGPRAHYIALEPHVLPGRKAHFISNIDPDDAAMVLKQVNLATTLVLVVSKTGTTLETLTNEALVKHAFIEAGLNPAQHFVSISSQHSPMDDKSKYLECFYIWDWIGGRYSTTSMVGGVMLAFAFGFSAYEELLKGAHAMDEVALGSDIKTNLPMLGALLSIWNRNFLNHPTLSIIPYSQSLARYPAHIQQVEMESNGKHIDQSGAVVDFSTGMVIFGEPGTNAQHSFFQLFHQGTDIIPIEFIGFKECQCGKDREYEGISSQEMLLSNLFAQAISLACGQHNDNPNKMFNGNRPSHILLAKELTPYTLGALLSYFENKVAFEGFLWGINSFDQEGVQLGKVLAKKVIDRFKKDAKAPYPLGDAYIEQLNFL